MKSPIIVTRHVEFEAAHLLDDYPGACANLHGHSYKLEVSISGQRDNKFGFVMDFKDLNTMLKEIVPDHAYIYNTNSASDIELNIANMLISNGNRVWAIPCTASAENMSEILANDIQAQLPEGLKVVKLKLWETTNSFATWEPPTNTEVTN